MSACDCEGDEEVSVLDVRLDELECVSVEPERAETTDGIRSALCPCCSGKRFVKYMNFPGLECNENEVASTGSGDMFALFFGVPLFWELFPGETELEVRKGPGGRMNGSNIGGNVDLRGERDVIFCNGGGGEV